MHVGLDGQVLGRSVGGIVVNDKESIDAQATVVLQKSRETQPFIPARGERKNFPWGHRVTTVAGPVDENRAVSRVRAHFPEETLFSVSKKIPRVDCGGSAGCVPGGTV